MLPSFSAALLLDDFARLFPQAQFVLTSRAPRALVRSLLRCNWVDRRDGSPLAYTRNANAARRFVKEFMALTMRSSRRARSQGRVLTMPYEQLCARPEAAMERLGSFLRVAPPKPCITEESARLVTQSLDNPHPPLRPGPVAPKR